MRLFPILAALLAAVVLCLAIFGILVRRQPQGKLADSELPQGEAESSPAPRLALQVGAENPEPNPEIWEEQAPLVHGLSTEAILDLAARSPSAWTRADALEELAARRSSSALAIFLDGLSDMDPSVRRVAADGLAELGNHGAVSTLVRALSREAAERTRAAMAQAITELQPEPQQ